MSFRPIETYSGIFLHQAFSTDQFQLTLFHRAEIYPVILFHWAHSQCLFDYLLRFLVMENKHRAFSLSSLVFWTRVICSKPPLTCTIYASRLRKFLGRFEVDVVCLINTDTRRILILKSLNKILKILKSLRRTLLKGR